MAVGGSPATDAADFGKGRAVIVSLWVALRRPWKNKPDIAQNQLTPAQWLS